MTGCDRQAAIGDEMSDGEHVYDEEVEMREDFADKNDEKKVYLPGQPLDDGEKLMCDKSAYIMLHQIQTGSPCLSFDIIQDKESDGFPICAYVVAGTQAPQGHANSVIVMKMSNMNKTQKDSDDSESESDDSSDEESDNSPKLTCALIDHRGCVNRVKSCVFGNSVLAASWSEIGSVNVWDLTVQLQAVDDFLQLSNYRKREAHKSSKPLFSFKGHQTEGFALDWCPTMPGMLASGDSRQGLHIWHPAEGGIWQVDQRSLVGHSDSVEDLQWSPNEKSVLASCSVDKSIRVWDVRCAPQKACKLTVQDAHELDVNVISWNRNEPFIVSGGDDGIIHVWDLRHFEPGSAVATFKHHTQPITTVEWHPKDGTVFASGGADDQIALWDLAVEYDSETREDVEDVPSQLLFIHQGQTDIKELHWHRQFPGVIISTALEGLNVFKTISA